MDRTVHQTEPRRGPSHRRPGRRPSTLAQIAAQGGWEADNDVYISGDLLPRIVDITARDADLIAALARDKRLLKDFAATKAEPTAKPG